MYKKKNNRLIWFLFFIFLAVFILLAFNYDSREFPKLTKPKKITLTAKYHNQKITLIETLYKSVDDYYGSEPKKNDFGDNLGSFVFSYPQDKTIDEITNKIKKIGKKLKLNRDETMDLATAFVQNIPYDKKKGRIVLSDELVSKNPEAALGRFPYETLYDNKGICTDKSYLEAAILKKMGYGASLFVFNKETHMAVGVKVPKGYTSFNTNYSYLETTNTGFKVGDLPVINNSGIAEKLVIKLPKSDSQKKRDFIPEIPRSNFSAPSKIYKISDGIEYMRIIETRKVLERIKELIAEINSRAKLIIISEKKLENEKTSVENSKSKLNSYEAKLKELKNTYELHPTAANYSNYSRAYKEYKNIYNNTSGEINKYNQKVKDYNQKVLKLDGMVNEYNKLVKSD